MVNHNPRVYITLKEIQQDRENILVGRLVSPDDVEQDGSSKEKMWTLKHVMKFSWDFIPIDVSTGDDRQNIYYVNKSSIQTISEL